MNTSENPTLVLIPGLVSDHVVWQPVADAFSDEMSPFIATVSSADSIVGMAQDILSELNGSLLVVGHSLGGRIALEMVRLAPERITRLVLLDTGAHPIVTGEEVKREENVRIGFNQGMAAFADHWLPPMVDKNRHHDVVLMDTLKEMVLRSDAPRLEQQIRALINRPDATDLLSKITCPVLYMVGATDAWSTPDDHKKMAALTPVSTLVIVEGAGHFLPIEHPNAVIDAMRNWMK